MIHKIKIILSLFIIVLLLIGCVTIPPLQTTTGRAEVTVNNVTKKDVSDALVNFMLTNDYQLQRMDEYNLIFAKTNTDLGSALLFGSQYDSSTQLRYGFNLVDVSNGVRVVSNIGIVTNPGSAFERVTDLSKSSKAAHDMQSILVQMKNNFDNFNIQKSRGKIGINYDKNYVITDIIKGKPAFESGIQIGDKIIKIDGEDLSNIEFDNAMRITGEPGTSVTMTVLRNGEEMTYTIIRGEP